MGVMWPQAQDLRGLQELGRQERPRAQGSALLGLDAGLRASSVASCAGSCVGLGSRGVGQQVQVLVLGLRCCRGGPAVRN